MKNKIIWMAIWLACATGVKAQYSDWYYHQVGDTIETRSEIGYYAWWEFEDYFANNRMLLLREEMIMALAGSAELSCSGEADSTILLQRYYTPTPLRIVGVAAAGETIKYNDAQPHIPLYFPDTADRNFLLVYDALPDSFPLVGSVRWNIAAPHRTLHVSTHVDSWVPGSNLDTSCCRYAPYDWYIPIREFYFDSVVTVNDSFYVGSTFYGENRSYLGNQETRFWAIEDASLRFYPCSEDQNYYEIPEFPGLRACILDAWPFKLKMGTLDGSSPLPEVPFDEAPWIWFENTYAYPIIYPLIEVDTTVPPATACVPVANVQATVEGTTATVTWDGFPNYTSLRLRYGFAAHPQSVWTEVTLPQGTTMYTLSGLLPTMPYGVTLQAECEKKETEWSAPVTFYTGQDTSSGGQGTEGVEETMLSRLTFLAPNPARDEVTVTSSFNLSRIEIHDLQGVMVFSEPVSGHDVTLPLDFLRSGTYIVSIHTHNGTTHKRLAVAR